MTFEVPLGQLRWCCLKDPSPPPPPLVFVGTLPDADAKSCQQEFRSSRGGVKMQAQGLGMALVAFQAGCNSAVGKSFLIQTADIRPKGLLNTALLPRDREGLSRTPLCSS